MSELETAAKIASSVVDAAAHTAQQVVLDAATTEIKIREATTEALSTALRDVFGEGVASGRFVDVSRIPLICKSVIDTNERLKEISDKLDNKFVTKELFEPVRLIVYGLVGMIIVAVFGALIGMVLIK